MPPWGPDLENKSILFYSILFISDSNVSDISNWKENIISPSATN